MYILPAIKQERQEAETVLGQKKMLRPFSGQDEEQTDIDKNRQWTHTDTFNYKQRFITELKIFIIIHSKLPNFTDKYSQLSLKCEASAYNSL